jgi:hypothetical protein
VGPPGAGCRPRRLRLARGSLVQRLDQGTEGVGQDLNVPFEAFDPRADRRPGRPTRSRLPLIGRSGGLRLRGPTAAGLEDLAQGSRELLEEPPGLVR